MELRIFSQLALTFLAITTVRGHGRLLDPPGRSSLFRFVDSDPALIPYRDVIQPNYNDNQLNCGGREVQIANEGKCGVCGDSYSAPIKENEAGGKYALGIITRNYKQGQTVDVEVEITAEHKGYFEFRICPWNNVHLPVTHECLNQHLLMFESGLTKWYLPEDSSAAQGVHHLNIRLPDDVNCAQCVFQWRYRTGNSWGYENGKQGLGLGQQEEFYGCSDISIQPTASEEDVESSTSSSTSPQNSSTMSPSTSEYPIGTTYKSGEEFPPEPEVDTERTFSPVQTTEATDPNPDIDCSQVEPGKPIFRDCHSFFMCAFTNYPPYVFACPEGTLCHPELGRCLNPWDVPSCNSA